MFIPPHNELAPPPLQRPERRPGQSASGSSTPVTASLVPTERQSVNGVEVLHAGNALASNYPNMPHARIYHPKQAPSADLASSGRPETGQGVDHGMPADHGAAHLGFDRQGATRTGQRGVDPCFVMGGRGRPSCRQSGRGFGVVARLDRCDQ